MSILSDKNIRQVYSHLKMKPPEWIPEIDKAVAEDAYRETLKMVMEYLDDKLGYDYSGIRTKEILALNKLEVSNGR